MDRRVRTDVLVVGGGTAGFGAAMAAGRAGLDVILLEATNRIGGVMAFCPGMPWGAAFPAGVSVGGLMAELTGRLEALSPPAAEKRPCALENFGPEILYDPDLATLTMFEMLEQAGVQVRLHATAIEPNMRDARIDGVTCYDRNGAFEIKPRIVIDCSGDGDISARAGVPYTLGDDSGNMMGVTLSFHMLNVEWDEGFADGDPYFTEFAQQGISEGRLHGDLAKLYLMKGFHPGTVFCNSVVIRGVDGTDPVAVARATQEGRRRCYQLSQYLIERAPGFGHARMAQLGPTVGVRETRKLEAIYRVTGQDLARCTKFADGIVCCDNPIDDVMRADASMTHDAVAERGGYYTIPFRSLVPRYVENLMFAGRILCADPVAFASVRGMPQCMAMGQATGTAALLALQSERPVQDLDTDGLISALQAQGVNGLGGAVLTAPAS